MLWGAMGLTLPHCCPQEQASWVCRCEAQWRPVGAVGAVGLGALWACGLSRGCYGVLWG